MLEDKLKFNENGELINPEDIKQIVIDIAKKRGVNLNLDNPVTIQDKLNWLMIYDCNALKTKCVDKYLLREYCVEKLGVDICLPLIAVYNSTDEITWDKLPNEFVIKCNHGSGMNILVKNKANTNKQNCIDKLNCWMNDNFALRNTYEAQYYNVPRKIIVEKLMKDELQKDSLFDYKFWCFNGKPKFYTINDGNGHGSMIYLDMDNNQISISRNDFKTDSNLVTRIPKNFSEMKRMAELLSMDFKFVRVDFYEICNKVYLGELTFTPGACYFKYKNTNDDIKIGELLEI